MDNTISKQHHRSSLSIGTIISYISIIVEIITGILYVPWMIGKLGNDSYAIYSLATSIAMIFTIDFGLSAAASKFVSKYKAFGDEETANKYASMIYKMMLYIDGFLFVIFGIILASLGLFYGNKSPEELSSLRVVFAIVGSYMVLSFPTNPNAQIYIGNDKYTFSKVVNLITHLVTVSLIIIALSSGLGLVEFVSIHFGVELVSRIVTTIQIRCSRKLYGNKMLWKFWDKEIFHDIISYSIWQGVCTILSKIIIYSVPSILRILCGSDIGTDQIAYYQVGLTIDNYVMIFATAINGIFISRLTYMKVEQVKKENLADYWIKISRIQLIVTSLLLVGFVTLGRGFLGLWLANNEEITSITSVYLVSILLAIPELFLCTQQMGDTLLIIEDKYRYHAILYAITCVSSLLLTIGIIYLVNNKNLACIIAASVSCATRMLGLVVGSIFLYHRHLKLDMKKIYIETHLKTLPVLIIMFVLGFALEYFWPTTKWIYFILKGIIITLTYMVLTWLLTLKPYEKEYFINFIRKFLHFNKKSE